MRLTIAVTLGLLTAACPAVRADLRIHPPQIALGNAKAAQQLLVTEDEAGRTVADRTAGAAYRSSNPAVATVGPDGVVKPVADGEAVVTADVGGRTATAKVVVSGTKAAFVPSFRNHVEPILTRAGCNSGACHGALAGKGGFKLSLRGFDPTADHFVMTRQALARRVDQTNPENSMVLRKPTRALPHGGGQRFTEDDPNYQLLLDWVRAGAPGPRDAEPTLVRIELFPGPARLKPKDTIRVTVRGHYSDGSTADVTRWTRFGSTADLVATVDEEGLVKVAGSGEAAITANFGTKVAGLTVTVPYPAGPDQSAFSGSPKYNLIDTHVLDKLKELRVPPSGQCSDAEFIRRVFLDTCGVLPKPDEVKAFLADSRPDKRARLVDQLLDRPEYVDYWAHKWSDLLLVSSRKLPQPAMWAFYRSVRQAVADNRPWDRFARDVLTASGSTLTNGAANYFVLHKEVTDLVESTAVTFLGTSINCCRCHNHPLEKWTQDQYWATANLFARVGLKNGDRAGEVFVRSLPDGDALHLRRGVAIPPAPLDGKPLPPDAPADRRQFFADWLTAPDNPYFARAAVNRVWRNFMGRGLVEPEDDLRETNPPSHPALLDALVKEFVAHKYDVKHLIRLIANSAAYQRSAASLPGNAADDRFYSRYLIRRLSAEVILDAYSDVTGVATPFTQLKSAAGDSVTPITMYPPGTRALQIPDALLASQFLDSFGRAERLQTCSCEKTTDASVGQALHLNNGQTLNAKLRDKASRVGKWNDEKAGDAEIVDRLFLLALTRPPTEAERAKMTAVLAGAMKDGPAARREAVEDLFWAVLTSQEFLFNR
jgi:hypothetical protein